MTPQDERRGRGQFVQETSELPLDLLRRSAAARRTLTSRREREQVVTLIIVEMQDTDECCEH